MNIQEAKLTKWEGLVSPLSSGWNYGQWNRSPFGYHFLKRPSKEVLELLARIALHRENERLLRNGYIPDNFTWRREKV